MKAISLHQPWASLCVTRQPCDFGEAELTPDGCRHPIVKRFETRSWPCPPNLIGQRIALHATKRRPRDIWHDIYRDVEFPPLFAPFYDHHRHVDIQESGDGAWFRYRWAGPLGAIVGSAVIEACVEILKVRDDGSWTIKMPTGTTGVPGVVLDQLPYGDFTPGRYAWLLGDAAPTTERCPWCWGECRVFDDSPSGVREYPCMVCDRTGRCEPIPAQGRQRIWNWTPG